MEQDIQYQQMVETPIRTLIPKMAVPTIISMLVTAIYNIADTYFVSKLGTSASGAVGIVFSLMAVIQAVGFTIGMGCGSWISRLLGAKDEKKTIEVGASGFYAALIFGILLAGAGLSNLDSLMKLLGASKTILPFAKSYGTYILYAAPVMTSSFVLNNILRSEGRAKFAMVGISVGGVLNVILDPIFIFQWNLGIAGAAIATAISQCVSFLILFLAFITKKTVTRLGIHRVSKDYRTYAQILKNGLPSLARQGLSSGASILLNTQSAVYGDPAVAAMSIVTKVFMVIFSIVIGFGQGYQPVAGYNYGAGNQKRVTEAMKFTLIVGTVFMSLVGIFVFLFSEEILGIFIAKDQSVVDIGSFALRAQCISMPFLTIGIVGNMTFQSIGKSWIATFLSSLRQGIFFMPLILLLPQRMGMTGVEITQAVSDILTAFISGAVLWKFYRSIS